MKVDAKHPEYEARLPEWQMCRDLLAGEAALKRSDRIHWYVPPLPGHVDSPSFYDPYVRRGVLYNAFARTHEGLAGLVSRKDPSVEIPAGLEAWSKNVTGTGITLVEFAWQVVDELLAVGRVGVFVDYPEGSEEGLTRAQVAAAGRAPRWSLWTAESVINWRTTVIDGAEVVSRVVLMEEVLGDDPEDEFVQRATARARVLDLVRPSEAGAWIYRQRLFTREAGGDRTAAAKSSEWSQQGGDLYPRRRGQLLSRLPFHFLNAEHTLPETCSPPLLDLASMNVAHFRDSCALHSALQLAGSPNPWVAGDFAGGAPGAVMDGGDGDPRAAAAAQSVRKLRMGGGEVWHLTMGSQVGMVEVDQAATSALTQAQNDKRTEMVILGGRVIESEARPAESGVAKEIDDDRDASALARIAKVGGKGLTAAALDARDWMPEAVPGDVAISLNTDFFGRAITAAEAAAWADLWQKRVIAKSDVRRILRRGDAIPADRTDEMIDDELEQEDPLGGGGDEGGAAAFGAAAAAAAAAARAGGAGEGAAGRE